LASTTGLGIGQLVPPTDLAHLQETDAAAHASTLAGVAPSIVILAGPNGAGKSTAAPFLLRDALAVTEFVNADQIAQGLSAFSPETVAIAAGRLMLARLDELARRRETFAFETTLASRSFAPWLRARRAEGYAVSLVFLWLPDSSAAVRRVAERVARGGHPVPPDVVRRRYAAGLRNFFRIYQPLCTAWRVYDTSGVGPPRLLAAGHGTTTWLVMDDCLWDGLVRQWTHG
jgi:predicted ABC-type ATPase